MCGIAGLHRVHGNDVIDHEKIAGSLVEMIRSIGHRGPDDRGTIILEGKSAVAALANTRLAILDLRPEGHQPMMDAGTRNWITYNGEVYNYLELKDELHGAGQWMSRTDTEVVLKAYSRWGRDCVSHLQGMFAFAIWDAGREELFIARDRLGIKPLYYYADAGLFIFASEVRAILATGLFQKHLDAEGLWGYLGYQCLPGDRTLIRDVHMLPPGWWMTVNPKGEISKRRYWHLLESASTVAKESDKGESERRVGELLRESVAYHLASDVPLGVFLSGGVDSSLIVGLMREMGQVSHTFNVICPGIYDESQYARMISREYGSEHSEILVTQDQLLDLIAEALDSMDQPTGDGINTFVVSQAVRASGLKVALSGLGGDEFFGGYPSFGRLSKMAHWSKLWAISPGSIRSSIANTFRSLSGSFPRSIKIADLLESDGSLPALYVVMRQVFPSFRRDALLANGQSDYEDPYVSFLEQSFRENSWAGVTSAVSYFEGATYLPDVLLRDTDQMSMATSLEVRVPFLDHKLVEYLIGLSDSNKKSNGVPKRLMNSSLDNMLPMDILRRPKQGFTLPFDTWMHGRLRDFCSGSLTRLGERGILRPEKIQELWKNFCDGRKDTPWPFVWVLVVLDQWLARNELAG